MDIRRYFSKKTEQLFDSCSSEPKQTQDSARLPPVEADLGVMPGVPGHHPSQSSIYA